MIKTAAASSSASYQAVFISDLHLHPQMPEISKRFDAFIQWAARSTQSLYILGDFFHVWPGDEALDEWSDAIANQLAWLKTQGVKTYFMPGNRDFLLGQTFLDRACMTLLPEPSVIQLDNLSILLVHGDRYCTRDISHQCLRWLTRNALFKCLFLRLPYSLRARLVNRVRTHSQNNRQKPYEHLGVVESSVLRHVKKTKVHYVIHGHTHQPGLIKQPTYQRYVLSDWDDLPILLCYNKTKGLLLNRQEVLNGC